MPCDVRSLVHMLLSVCGEVHERASEWPIKKRVVRLERFTNGLRRNALCVLLHDISLSSITQSIYTCSLLILSYLLCWCCCCYWYYYFFYFSFRTVAFPLICIKLQVDTYKIYDDILCTPQPSYYTLHIFSSSLRLRHETDLILLLLLLIFCTRSTNDSYKLVCDVVVTNLQASKSLVSFHSLVWLMGRGKGCCFFN